MGEGRAARGEAGNAVFPSPHSTPPTLVFRRLTCPFPPATGRIYALHGQ